jgi:hypothetical protein
MEIKEKYTNGNAYLPDVLRVHGCFFRQKRILIPDLLLEKQVLNIRNNHDKTAGSVLNSLRIFSQRQ